MEHPILSLHHVTATVNDAQEDLDFCADALGLRLVKKTVNFDNHHVYHFYCTCCPRQHTSKGHS